MSDTETGSLPEDTVFDMLSSPRRRYVLYYLRQRDGRAELNEIAEQVAAWENEIPVDEISSQQRKRVYVSLYQTHVPKMQEANVIAYDADAGVVTLADHANEIGDYLGDRSSTAVPWQLFYLGLSVASALFVGAVLVDVLPLTGLQAALVVTLAFAASALGHYVYQHREGTNLPPEMDT